jgi:hypothetical protein
MSTSSAIANGHKANVGLALLVEAFKVAQPLRVPVNHLTYHSDQGRLNDNALPAPCSSRRN